MKSKRGNTINKIVNLILGFCLILLGIASIINCIIQSMTMEKEVAQRISFLSRSITGVCCMMVGLFGFSSSTVKQNLCHARVILSLSYAIGLCVLLAGQFIKLFVRLRYSMKSSELDTIYSLSTLTLSLTDLSFVLLLLLCLVFASKQLRLARLKQLKDAEKQLRAFVLSVDFPVLL